MKITKEQIKELNPCKEELEYYLANKEENLLKLLIKTNNYRSDWATWLFVNLMTDKQRIRIAIFSTKQILHVFEEKYPEDNRPQLAIEIAENYLVDPSKKNAYVANVADYTADTANAANTAYAAYATWTAADAYAAGDAVTITNATHAAITYAAYASAHDKKELQEKIIREAVKILEEV